MSKHLTVGDVRQLLTPYPDDIIVGIHVDGNSQGHALLPDEGLNVREDIFWFRATTDVEDE